MKKNQFVNCRHCKMKNINNIYAEEFSCDICVELKVDQFDSYLSGDKKSLYKSIIHYEDYDNKEREKLGLKVYDPNKKKRISGLINELENRPIDEVILTYQQGLLDEQANT